MTQITLTDALEGVVGEATTALEVVLCWERGEDMDGIPDAEVLEMYEAVIHMLRHRITGSYEKLSLDEGEKYGDFAPWER